MSISSRIAAVAGLLALLLTGGCAQVQPHLSLPALTMGEPAFAATIEGYAGSPVVGGNRVELLLNGDQIFPAKIKLINSAKRTITYAQYVFEEGQWAGATAKALADRCQAGVQVNVLLDAVGALGMPAEYRQTMVDAGCRVEMFRPLSPFTIDRVNNRNHRRILVVDGLVAVTGGAGTSGKWEGNGRRENHWRDTDVLVEGPVVEQLQGAFAENWLDATGIAIGGADYFPRPIPPRGSVMSQAVRSSPAGGSGAMYTMFLLAFTSARRSIDITNPYFVPDDKMMQTLLGAARRGVRVRLLMPGAIDHNIVRQASRSELGALLRQGVEIYEYRPSMLHAKTMVIDGMWATVGSTNLDRRSFALNDELNLVMYDRNMARSLEKVFDDDVARSRRVTYEAWNNRGIRSRLLEFLALPIRDQL